MAADAGDHVSLVCLGLDTVKDRRADERVEQGSSLQKYVLCTTSHIGVVASHTRMHAPWEPDHARFSAEMMLTTRLASAQP